MNDFVSDFLNLCSNLVIAAGLGTIVTVAMVGNTGCVYEQTYRVRSCVDDVWNEEPKQSIIVEMEIKG